MKKALKIVLSSINILIVILLFVSSVLFILLTHSSDRQIFGFSTKLIEAESYNSLFENDTFVVLKESTVLEVKKGDIALISQDGIENVIRVTNVKNNFFYYKNYLNFEEAIELNDNNLLGRVIFSSSFLGKICSFILNDGNGILIYILIFGLFVISMLILAIINIIYNKKKAMDTKPSNLDITVLQKEEKDEDVMPSPPQNTADFEEVSVSDEETSSFTDAQLNVISEDLGQSTGTDTPQVTELFEMLSKYALEDEIKLEKADDKNKDESIV